MNNTKIVFSSSLENIVKCNDSFDLGVLQIAYHGKNRNGTLIKKETMERCARKSIYNVPVVANYKRKTDSIGAHDIEIIQKSGRPTMVNVTHPIGVVPESASFWWKEVEEPNGAIHEYICADVLLWKRQEAYYKVKKNGITFESMEILINKSHREGDVLVIDDFEFQAFCLLGDAEPCFESASLTTFSKDEFYLEFASMLSDAPDAIKNYLKGVTNKLLKEKLKLMESYGLTIDDIDFELEDFTLEELKEKFEAIKRKKDEDDSETTETPVESDETSDKSVDDPHQKKESSETTHQEEDEEESELPSEEEDDEKPKKKEHSFMLNSEFEKELRSAVRVETVEHDGFSEPRYFVLDYDTSMSVVYCIDTMNNWTIVRINYIMNGDSIAVDFKSSKRVKVTYEEFNEGDIEPTETDLNIEEAVDEYVRRKIKCATKNFSAKLKAVKKELETLKRHDAEEVVFSKFADLTDNPDFQTLRANCAKFDLDTLEEKCFAIRGRVANFSLNYQNKFGQRRLPVDAPHDDYEPYGGVVRKYTNCET